MPTFAVNYILKQETDRIVPQIRNTANTTHFGWDSFEAPSGPALLDTTPDMGNTAITGAKFETTNGQLHRASSTSNFYSGGSPTAQTAEKITIPTNGTPGVTGKTTIIVQMSAASAFISSWTFSAINGVTPQVVQGVNGANRGQAWAKWELPGNAASYEFNLGSVAHPSFAGAHMSFDKIEIDTFWSEAGDSIGDAMILEPVPLISVLEQLEGFVTPSSRNGTNTTLVAWDTFGTSGVTAPINDNTPDIGTDTTGTARFETMNGEVHQFSGGGNLYLLSFTPPAKTLDENITVPTKGTVGTAGYTTIILQIASASSGMGGSDFAGGIFLKPINGVAPTIVQGPSANTAQLWAKWVIPGNQATYTIEIDGEPEQDHYSFDKVIVDTKFSLYAPVGDTMRPKTVVITPATLLGSLQNTSYSAQLQATGSTGPYAWTLAAGSTLPAGLTLTPEGWLSGTPTTLGLTTFTVEVEDGSETYANEITYNFHVVDSLVTVTTNSLVKGVVGMPYSQAALTADGGADSYTWSLSAGTLPAGLTFNANGTITGTPTAVGTASITVQVTDISGFTATKVLSLEVVNLTIATTALPRGVINVDYLATLVATGGTAPYTWDITGLPAGIDLDEATGKLNGKTTAAATVSLTVEATDHDGNVFSKNIDLVIADTFIKPVIDPITFPAATIGAAYSHTVTAANYPKTFTITGLPKGLTYVAATGVISGRPSVSGAYLVQVRATNSAGASVIRPATLVVKALPASLVGSFTGLVSRNTVNTGLGSLFNLTTTTTGAYTLQVKSGSATKSVKGFLNVSGPQVVADLGGSTISLSVNLETALIAGTQGEATVQGWRTKWDTTFNPASGREGYYSVALNLADEEDLENNALPQGTGFATFSVVPAGTLKIAGKTADGQAITASTALGPNGEIAFYSTAYANKGTVLGKWTLEDNDFIGNTVEGELSWQKPATTGLTYPAAFGPLDITVAGGYLAPSAKGPVMAGLPEEGSIEVAFEAGGIAT